MSLCECGCGQDAGTYTNNDRRWGYVKGEPRRFIPGHIPKGENHYNWKNGKTKRDDGRIMLWTGEISRKYESRQVVEDIIGKLLPPESIVHHIDHDPSNNHPSNLVVCNDQSHHRIIHARENAYKACGHANWRKCRHCHQYDDLKNMITYSCQGKSTWYHQECNTRVHREYMQKRKARDAKDRL